MTTLCSKSFKSFLLRESPCPFTDLAFFQQHVWPYPSPSCVEWLSEHSPLLCSCYSWLPRVKIPSMFKARPTSESLRNISAAPGPAQLAWSSHPLVLFVFLLLHHPRPPLVFPTLRVLVPPAPPPGECRPWGRGEDLIQAHPTSVLSKVKCLARNC